MGGKLFAISKFLRAIHSSAQRLIAFLLEGVEKSISTSALLARKKREAQSVVCVTFLCFKICHGIVTDRIVINMLQRRVRRES
jgi:hypothetical protein